MYQSDNAALTLSNSENHTPVGDLPPGNLPGGNLPEGQTPQGSLPPGESPEGLLPGVNNLASFATSRRKKRREDSIRTILSENICLSSTAQENLLQLHLSEGWGKLAHGITRQLKSPGRFGLKLVDVALIMTVYDHTIAAVNSTLFAPIGTEDFASETGMDKSNIRVALNSLEKRAILFKIKTGFINFWAINPHYFAIKLKGNLPSNNSRGGNSPVGNAPCVKEGNLPGGEGGQITSGQSDQTSGNQKDFSDAKNLLQESKKESSLDITEFPKDMQDRWSYFKKVDLGKKVDEEKKIFQELFIQFGNSFFEQCGSIVTFLEKNGNGKKGPEGKVLSPMHWIQNHWEANLARYQSWKNESEALAEAHAKKLDKEAKTRARDAAKERIRSDQEQKDLAWQTKMDAAADRFLSRYQSPEKIEAFAAEAMEIEGNQYTRSNWERGGWTQPIARACVLEHFLKVESGKRVSQVAPDQLIGVQNG